MTRSARRNLKKTPLSATPWKSLKKTKYTPFKDEDSTPEKHKMSTSKVSGGSAGLRKVRRGQLKETKKEKLKEKPSHKLVKKFKQIKTGKKLRKQVLEDSDTVSLLSSDHTKARATTKKFKENKRKIENNFISNEDLEGVMENPDDALDTTPLLSPQNRAALKKQRQAEARRLRRQKRKVCFNCRKAGHMVEDCPEPQTAGICYKCGSADHTSRNCPTQSQEEYPYAKCFICGEIGHLSKSCPDNPKGLYPHGGCCKHCGSVEHLRANCPDKTNQGINQSSAGYSGLLANPFASADAEDMPIPPPSSQPTGGKSRRGRGRDKITKSMPLSTKNNTQKRTTTTKTGHKVVNF